MINCIVANTALSSWSKEITQERATILITEEYLQQQSQVGLALHKITYSDGTVDHDALRRNRINIFHRWRKCETDEQRAKFEILIPVIIAAIQKDNPDMHKQFTAGNSVEYLVSRLLKENTEAVNAALNGAPLLDFERECDDVESAIAALRHAYRQKQYQRHDQ
ncbi:toxin YdaT family protein [Klebsiella aerogenes]|uniref:toxin YdaT family protein n=1 Tax=Klebsiella aerogenes TaxID=548 RepID=UPI001BCAAD34|nr:toxin YdaT family protein [Klebsiella aerogenes]